MSLENKVIIYERDLIAFEKSAKNLNINYTITNEEVMPSYVVIDLHNTTPKQAFHLGARHCNQINIELSKEI